MRVKKRKKLKITNSKRLIAFVGSIILFIALISFIRGFLNKRHEAAIKAKGISVNGEVLAKFREIKDLNEIMNLVKAEKEDLYDAEVELSLKAEIVDIKAEDKDLTKKEEFIEVIRQNTKEKIMGYSILIGEKTRFTFRSEADAMEFLDGIKDSERKRFEENGAEAKTVNFVKEIRVAREECDIANIVSKGEAINQIQKEMSEGLVHVLEKGENFWSLATKYNTTVDEIMKMNPGKTAKNLKIGDKIVVGRAPNDFEVKIEA